MLEPIQGTEAKLENAVPSEGLPPGDPKTESPKPEATSERIAAVIAEKKRVMALQKAAKSKEELVSKRERELEEREAKIKDLEAKFSSASDPIAALQAKGFSYKDATEYVLNNQQLTPEQMIKQIRDEFDSYRKSQEEKELESIQKAKDQEQQRYAQVKQDYFDKAKAFLDAHPDEYELIRIETELHEGDGRNATETIVDVIEAHFLSTKEKGKPEVLSFKDAADLVENHYLELAEKRAQTKKIQAKFRPAEEKKEMGTGPGTSRTLSNAGAGSSAPVLPPARSDEERMQRAIAAAEKASRL